MSTTLNPHVFYFTPQEQQSMNTKNNFTLIAELTTKYYIELKNNHSERFKSERQIIFAAGVIDATTYLFIEKSIKIDDIEELFDKIKPDDDLLINFILSLGKLMFKVEQLQDSIRMMQGAFVNYRFCDAEEIVKSEKDDIVRAIKQTLKNYNGDPIIALNVKMFMTKLKYRWIRELIGIKRTWAFL